MVVYLAVIGSLLIYMYFWERERPGFDKLPFLVKYRRFLVFALIGLIPPATVLLTIPAEKKLKGNQLIKYGQQHNQFEYVLQGYRDLAKSNPDNIEAQLDYIDKYSYEHRESDTHCKQLKLEYPDTLIRAYIDLQCDRQFPDTSVLYAYSNKRNVLYNYVLGLMHGYNGSIDSAEYYLNREIAFKGLKKRGYEALFYLASSNPQKLNKLLKKWEVVKYLDYNYLKDYYFHEGYFTHYLYNLYYASYIRTNWFTVAVALLVSMIWLIYVRTVDVFEPEKWRHLILVFLLSALATNLCLYIYDYFDHYTALRLYDNTLKDFVYCVVVIGGSEEFIKLMPWLLFVWISRQANEPYDYILYASVSALGFAFAENLIYYESYDLQVIVVRALMSAVGHMFFASLVAYGIVLYKYRYHDKAWKWLLPLCGFVAGCIAHGFYDFWLISPGVSDLSILTMVFFIISLHIWHTLKNNALNNSSFYTNKAVMKNDVISFFLLASFISVLMIEYLITSYNYGSDAGSDALKGRALTVAFFGVYIVSTFGNYRLQKGVWNRIRIPGIRHTLRRFSVVKDIDHTGLKLRLFAPKTNSYVGEQMPVTGTCIERIVVSGDSDWYVFDLDREVIYGNLVRDKAIIRVKNAGQNLLNDKIPIYFMMMENATILQLTVLSTENLRYMGRVYSRPLTE